MTAPNEGLPIGAPAPDFVLPDMQGREVSLEQLLMRARPLLFIFVSPTCVPCRALLPEIGKWQEELRDKIDFIFFSAGSAEENAAKLPRLGGQTLLLQKKRETAELYKAKWTPTVLLVNSAGTIASRPAAGDTAIHDLMARIKENDAGSLDYIENGSGMSPNKLKIGESIPEFELPESKGGIYRRCRDPRQKNAGFVLGNRLPALPANAAGSKRMGQYEHGRRPTGGFYGRRRAA